MNELSRFLRRLTPIVLILFLAACQNSEIVPKNQGVVQGQGIAYRWGNELWVADISGRDARRLASDLTDAFCADYAPSPNGRSLAYRDARKQLWVVGLTNDGATKLSNVPVDDFTWYPSSRGLTYTSGSTLYLQSIATSGAAESFNLQGRSVRRPTWSPDNSHIAFYLFHDGNLVDLAVLPFPASGLGDLRILDSFQMRPGTCPPEIRWSPDSKKLVAGDGSSQFVYFLVGGSPLPLGGATPAAAWSLDSRYLTYLDAKNRLLLRDLLNGDTQILVSAPTGSYVWDPSSNALVYTVRNDGADQLVLFELETKTRTVLVQSGVALELTPAWSRDGKTIFFGYRPTSAPAGITSLSRSGGAVQSLLPRASDFTLFERRSE